MPKPDWVSLFRAVLAEERILCDEDTLAAYATDETHEHHHPPQIVLKPNAVEEISHILALCSQHQIPVVPRGAGSGVSGGALASEGGVLLCLEKLNRILEINRRDQTITVETGAITGEVQTAVLAKGLWLPPDPGSKDWCQIGGNLAEVAAGPKSLKYGAFRDYVLNLEVVLASGEVIWTGANVRKSAMGYNLTQLMLGSEGTLGVITKVVFRLIPAVPVHLLMRLTFTQMEDAFETMGRVFEAGIQPCEMEFLDEEGISITRPHCKEKIGDNIKAMVWIGLDGSDQEPLFELAERIAEIAEAQQVNDVLVAEEGPQQKDLWEYRHQVGVAIIEATAFRDVDLCVPRSRLFDAVQGVKTLGQEYGFRAIIFGHAGDGNLHVQICRDQLSDEQWQDVIKSGIRKIYALVSELGGALSGEHGVGLVLREHLDLAYAPIQIELMRQIKTAFDPKGILNPGKMLPKQEASFSHNKNT